MKGTIAISCFFFLLWLVFAVSRSESQIDERIGAGTAAHTDTIDDYIKHEMALRKVPGLAFAMVDQGRIVTERTYGTANVETGSPVDTDSVFELASVTKPITAVAVMMLVEEGKIGLDDPISKYIANTPVSWNGITVRELLSHTAGLREEGLVKCEGSELVDISTKVQFEDLAKSPLVFSPGGGTQYSDAGYFLLGLSIETTSGQSYRGFLHDRIFTPLRMNHTSVLDQSAIIPKRVSPYTLRKGQLQNGRRVWQHELPSWYGVWSTVEDVARFDIGLSSHALLRQETLASMWTPTKLKNGDTASIEGMAYGLGWFVLKPKGHLVVAHPGWTGTFLLRYPEDQVSIIVLTNLDAGSGDHNVALAQGILTLLRPQLPKFRDDDKTK